jgi:hypothetical protein
MSDPNDVLLMMMNKLQQAVSGQAAAGGNMLSSAVISTRRPRRVTTAVALMLNSSLAAHPVFHIGLTRRARVDSYLRSVVSGIGELAVLVQSTAPPPEVLRTLNWTQLCAETLERHRLASIFQMKEADVAALIDSARNAAHHATIADDLVLPAGPSPFVDDSADADSSLLPSTPIQWPCSTEFHVLFGPLASADGVPLRQLAVRNATDYFVTLAHQIQNDPYDTMSWRRVVMLALDMPVSQCRAVWEQACFLFPTCGSLIVAYLQREIDLLEGNAVFTDTDDVLVAKEQFTARLRVLNVFARHLMLCSSPALWLLFFAFVARFVDCVDASLDSMFRVALEKSAGPCVDSADLWIEYIRWRSGKISHIAARNQWVRRIYLRVLVLPIDNLARLRAAFDTVEGKDAYGNQKKQDEETELRMTAARQMAAERSSKFEPMLCARFLSETEEEFRSAGSVIEEVNEPFMPAPFVAHLPPFIRHGSTKAADAADAARTQAAMLLRWREIIASEMDINMSGSRLEKAHAQRIQFFLRMQCNYFPHIVTMWLDAASHASSSFTHELLRDRVERVREIYDAAEMFHPGSPLLLCAYAEFLMRERVDDLRAASELLAARAKRLSKQAASDPTGVAVEQLVVLYVNWMRWTRSYAEISDAAGLTRLVARHAVVDTGLLLIIMTAVKRFVKERPARFTPVRHFRAFNVFCNEWLRLEVIGLRNGASGLAVLQAWASHLSRMVLTTKSQQWTLRMCGVDETFLASCRLLCSAYPSCVSAVLRELDTIVRCDAVQPQRHRCFWVELTWIRQFVQLADPSRAVCQSLGLASLCDLLDGEIDAQELMSEWADCTTLLGNAIADHRSGALPQVLHSDIGSAKAALCFSVVPETSTLHHSLLTDGGGEDAAPAVSSEADVVTPIASMWPKLVMPENPDRRGGTNRHDDRGRPHRALAQGGVAQQAEADVLDDDGEDADEVLASVTGAALIDSKGGRRKALERLSSVTTAVAAVPRRALLQHCVDRLLQEHLSEAALREGQEERARKKIRMEGGAVSPPPSSLYGDLNASGRQRAAAAKQQRVMARKEYRVDGALRPVAELLRALPSEADLASLLLPLDHSSAPVPGAGLDVTTRYLIDTLWASPSLRQSEE